MNTLETSNYEIQSLEIDSERENEPETENETELEELDTEWMNDFEKYNDFYKEHITKIDMIYMYISREKKVIDIQKRPFLLHNGCIKKEDLIYTIKQNNSHHNRKYGVFSIIQYNYHIDQEDILDYLRETKEIYCSKYETEKDKHKDILELNDDYLIYHNALNDIYFKPTITLFHQLNSLYILYYERSREKGKQNTTKKIQIPKTFLSSSKKKQHKKTYKKLI